MTDQQDPSQEQFEMTYIDVNARHNQLLISALMQFIVQFTSIPEVGKFTYADILSCMTIVLAETSVHGGCDSEPRLKVTLKNITDHFDAEVRDIWMRQAAIKAGYVPTPTDTSIFN